MLNLEINPIFGLENILTFKKGGGIHIKEKNKGKFTKSAKAAGESVQEHAAHVLSDPNATPLLKKRANFARNAAKWKHQLGGTLKLSPEELKYLAWSKLSPELKRLRNSNIAKSFIDKGPSISNYWNAAKAYFGGFNPTNPNLNTGDVPNPGMRNPKQIVGTVLKAKSIAQRAAQISDKVFDKQYFKALNSGNPQRVKAVRDLHFKGKSTGNQINKQLYHGTPEVFNEFKITDTADPIFHTTETKEVASKIAGSKGRVLNLFGYSKNPLRISDQGIVWHPSNIARELKVQLPRDKVRYPLEQYERELMYNLKNSNTYREEANRSFMEKELKGDSYVYKNEVEGGGDSYAFPTSRQLKLSNSVTYDDSGNIIPISKRDNFLNNDIRYKKGGKTHKPFGHRSILDNGWQSTKLLKNKKNVYGK